MEQVKEMLIRYNLPWRINGFEASIKEIEDGAKFDLPHDYKYYIENFKQYEGFIGPEYVRLWDADILLENNRRYNIFSNLNEIIGIGSNMGGECIAIQRMDQNKYRVILFDFIGMDEKYFIEIGSSFEDFFIRLDEGKKWFNK